MQDARSGAADLPPLEVVLQTLLQAQQDLTSAQELLDGLVERLYFHGELKWRDAAGELAGQIAGRAERRLEAVAVLLELQRNGAFQKNIES